MSTEKQVDEAIRTLRLKLGTRKRDPWGPQQVFMAEIGEVETLIAEIERLRERLSVIATMEDEENEWDAVSKFTACKILAREALPALERVGDQP